MHMSDLLRQYIMEIVSQVSDARVPTQLISKSKRGHSKDEETDEEMDEMSVVANIAGYTAPLGASSADVGNPPTKPGQKLKSHKKKHVRWK